MLILGIETSTRLASVALLDGDQVIAVSAWDATHPRQRSVLVARVQELFRSAGVKPLRCGGVAVSIGPGSFTGLRIGVACAKTLAYVARCPLVAVDTFAAIAANAPAGVDRVTVLADAQRGEFFVADYECGDGEWRSTGPVRIEGTEWLAARPAGNCLTGPGLAGKTAGSARILDEACWIPRAEAVARNGGNRLDRGEIADPMALEPLYVRRSAAEDKFDGMAGSPPI